MTGGWRRSPATALIGGAVIGALACGAALLFGFGAPVAIWLLCGALVGLIWWTIRHVIPAVGDIAVEELQASPDPWPTNAEQRTRVLESQIRGAGQGRTATVLAVQQAAEDVYVHPAVGRYAVAVTAATRDDGSVLVGASPRGSLALVTCARARALIDGRAFVIPDDIKALAAAGLAHRITIRGGGNESLDDDRAGGHRRGSAPAPHRGAARDLNSRVLAGSRLPVLGGLAVIVITAGAAVIAEGVDAGEAGILTLAAGFVVVLGVIVALRPARSSTTSERTSGE